MDLENRPRLAVITSHPIQYNAPVFAALSRQGVIEIKVFYCWPGPAFSVDREFGLPIEWDLPLLEGYEHELVKNCSTDPGTHHFFGLSNPNLLRKIDDWSPDCLLVYGWAWYSNLSALVHYKGKLPILFRGDSIVESSSRRGLAKSLRWVVLRQVYKRIDYALSPGQRHSEYLFKCGLTSDKILSWPHSIDVERFARQCWSEEAQTLRRRYGFTDDTVVLGFFGKLVERKNCRILLDAYEIICKREKSKFALCFVGDGPQREELERRARDLPSVVFVGFQNQTSMPAFYKMTDLVVLPSIRDTWGLVVNEALASGIPVVVSDRVGCAPDLVAGRAYGRVFRHDSASDLAEKISSLPATRRGLRAVGSSAVNVTRAFRAEAVAERLAALVVGISKTQC